MTDSDLLKNPESLFTLGYGLYIVTSHKDERLNGQISNAIMQVTDSPPRLAAAVNKDALTHEFISHSGVFTVNVLSESAPISLIRQFGFRSGRDKDKFSQVPYEIGLTGCPIVTDHVVACMEARVETTLECGTHTVFIGQVEAARIIGAGKPMTYAYYREVLQGKTPPTAPTYRASKAVVPAKKIKETSEMGKYVCDVCGYVYDPADGDPENGIEPGTTFKDLPDDWVCPECGVGKDEFSPVE